MGDPELVTLKGFTDKIYYLVGNGLPVDWAWYFRPFYYGRKRAVQQIYEDFVTLVRKYYFQRVASFEPGNPRNFTDHVLTAKEEAIAEDSAIAKYLYDDNLALVVSDLIFGKNFSQN